mmetsp:Transcript_98571/g.205539  ORF Transcript_98571/g.205539 Transcript_98571/m.205539 type:complete len:307 (+) Transcript_98571:89-1009(+)
MAVASPSSLDSSPTSASLYGSSFFPDRIESYGLSRAGLLELVEEHWEILRTFRPEDFEDEEDIILAGLRSNRPGSWEALALASPRLRANREIVFEAISLDGRALEYADEALQGDRDVVLEAVQRTGVALRFAASELRNDFEIVAHAVIAAGLSALQHASARLQQDQALLLEAWRRPQNDFVRWLSPDQLFLLGEGFRDLSRREAAICVPFALEGTSGMVAFLDTLKLHDDKVHIIFHGTLGLAGREVSGELPRQAKIKDLGCEVRASLDPTGEKDEATLPFLHLVLPSGRPVDICDSFDPIFTVCT